MRAKVTDDGVLIPKSLLPDVDEVDIRKRNGVIEVAPVGDDDPFPLSKLGRNLKREGKGIPKDDPLWQLGRNPVYDPDITDGSINHDKYIYGV